MEKKDASGMTYKETLPFIVLREEGVDWETRVTGDVELLGYCKWLSDNSYFKDEIICKPSGAL